MPGDSSSVSSSHDGALRVSRPSSTSGFPSRSRSSNDLAPPSSAAAVTSPVDNRFGVETCVSAPGKVLLTGGYLVLERPNPGLVLSLSARFHIRVTSEHINFNASDFCRQSYDSDTMLPVVSGDPSSTSSQQPGERTLLLAIDSRQFRYSQQLQFVENLSAAKPYGIPPASPTRDRDASTITPSDVVPLAEMFQLRIAPGTPAEEYQRNKFVELAVYYSLVCARTCRGESFWNGISESSKLTIEIFADNSFYSQADQLAARSLDRSSHSHAQLPLFLPPLPGHPIRKNGLGSSAALVTSICGGLLTHCGVKCANGRDRDRSGRELLHRLAQLVHCQAQGKIGSGFDVSAAVYGSQKYVRFSRRLLKDLLITLPKSSSLSPDVDVIGSSLESHRFSDFVLRTSLAEEWDHVHESFSLPEGMRLMMADVAQGSETPGMVANVMKWRRECTEDRPNAEGAEEKEKQDSGASMTSGRALWNSIAHTNAEIEARLRDFKSLVSNDPLSYDRVRQKVSSIDRDLWNTNNSVVISRELSFDSENERQMAMSLVQLRSVIFRMRQRMKEMGAHTGAFVSAPVDIEPDAQTALADASMAIPGVVAAGVPGAGGFDAIYALVIDDHSRTELERLWLSYADATVSVLPVDEDSRGFRVEQEVPTEAVGAGTAAAHQQNAGLVGISG